MQVVRPAILKGLFIGGFIISGMFLSCYAAHPVWGAESTQGPSDLSAPPAAPAPAPPSSTPAPAQGSQEEQGSPKMRKSMHRMQEACGVDIKQFCSAVKPGGGRIVQCLEEHQKEVSPGCNQLLTKHESRKGKGN
jgi:Cysteine rich repeat